MFSHDENNNFLINLHKKKEDYLSSAESASGMVNHLLKLNQYAATAEQSIRTARVILYFAAQALKNEIMAQHIEDQYFFRLGERNTTSYVTKTLDAIYDLIAKKPDLAALAYQEISLTAKEELKAALTYIAHKKTGLWKGYYQKIMELCALPIERNVYVKQNAFGEKKFAIQPGEKGFQLLSNSPSFFDHSFEKKDPMDSALISKDDCLIVRIWLPNEKAGVRFSFEAQQYSRKGSLFLTPICQMQDGFQRTYFNNYLSLANAPDVEDVLNFLPGQGYDELFDYYKFYQKMLMKTFLTTGMDYFIANVLLKMIADYAELDPSEKVKTLIALDTELQGSTPDYTFHLTGMHAEKIWERTLEYVYPEQIQIHQHILITKKMKTDVLDEVFCLFRRATNNQDETGKKLQSIYSLQESETKLEKLIGILSAMSAPAPGTSRLTQSS